MTDLNHFFLAGGFGSVRVCVPSHGCDDKELCCVVSFSPSLLMGEEENRKLDALIDASRPKKGFSKPHISASKHICFYCLKSI